MPPPGTLVLRYNETGRAKPRSLWLVDGFPSTRCLDVIGSMALRNSIGVVLPLIVGFALDMPRGGVVVASGALNVAYSDGSDSYAQRAKRMLSSSVLCALAVLLGGLSGNHNVAAVIIATLWALAAGLLVAAGTTAADLGVISLVTLLIYAAQPLTAQQALISSALAIGGGLLQTT